MRPSDEEILKQQEEIQTSIAREQLLVSDVSPIDELLNICSGFTNIASKVEDLKRKYKGFRKIRGDGNCFYRAYLVSVFEQFALRDTADTQEIFDAFVKKITESKNELVKLGFPEFGVEDFWETFCDQLKWMKLENRTTEDVRNMFCDSGLSDYLVMYARFLTSGFLQKNAEKYEPFIQEFPSVERFVRVEVEPMGREADHLQCMALASYLQIPVQIEYLDRSDGPITHVNFPDESDSSSPPFAHLLFRPGHYDVLEPL